MSRAARYPGQDMVSLTIRIPAEMKRKLYADSGGRPVPYLVSLIEAGKNAGGEHSWMGSDTTLFIKGLLNQVGPERLNAVVELATRLELVRLEDEAEEAKRKGRA